VGVKCSAKRGWASSHPRTAGALRVERLSQITWISRPGRPPGRSARGSRGSRWPCAAAGQVQAGDVADLRDEERSGETFICIMSVTTQPVRVSSAISTHGNPAVVASISFQVCARPWRGRGRSLPARSGCRPSPAPGAPGGRWARPPAPGRGGQQRDVAHAGGAQGDRGCHRDQHDSPVEQRRRARLLQRTAQGGGQSRLVGGLAEQDHPGVADQAIPDPPGCPGCA
jgi:hypothetical protein